jgi:hypothetical protein
VVQYIGELLRYLLAQPETPHDQAHMVRTEPVTMLAHPCRSLRSLHLRLTCLLVLVTTKELTVQVAKVIGNGLRPDIWEKFQSRFRIPYISEFYGACSPRAVSHS